MADAEATILRVLGELIERREEADAVTVQRESRLFDDLDMDSLEVAELSAALEDEFGTDPFTEGLLPDTVGEVMAFYAR